MLSGHIAPGSNDPWSKERLNGHISPAPSPWPKETSCLDSGYISPAPSPWPKETSCLDSGHISPAPSPWPKETSCLDSGHISPGSNPWHSGQVNPVGGAIE